MRLHRFPTNPLLTANQDPSIGTNLNGPSLLRAPDWLPHPLGRYYLYFSHHHGAFIRLATADQLEGPWRVYAPGTLRLEQTICSDHIASPDVHLDPVRRRIQMYFHGLLSPVPANAPANLEAAGQFSFYAESQDGITFTPQTEILGAPYFRTFAWQGWTYALGMPGIFYRSKDGVTGFERGPVLFSRAMRHTAVLVRGERLHVFYSNAGDCPERILHAEIDLRPDWQAWQTGPVETVLEPEREYEGADLPLEPSRRGWAPERVRQLRDPGIFEEDGRTYLFYSIAGEAGIAGAEILWD
jgi:hypothetical protein